jgi:hypothetical protein
MRYAARHGREDLWDPLQKEKDFFIDYHIRRTQASSGTKAGYHVVGLCWEAIQLERTLDR